ncbi:hypothetical protein GCM10007897_24940 [Sphingobium jiangsuense]|uniref:non-specific protein-tyrosine kinase n=1 Tax=Sphingobium jiangsuense TaxID=870476 RepID=A0A7W6FPA3_9SPHN|nr:polysaccharide biosynthesis tyrosine autokinase [Sphingobium jiangsuense]MBB3924824.1 uncharacterized protein involved in exopolysaccharide biosynthesis/Mrp family chromosome partitioning ATPase [Sphingobium jiangsuense]GLT01103.1 hypothetical protein GCM10007897_24940 [Sphingobium jiangsuense]
MEITHKVDGYERQLSDILQLVRDVLRRRRLTFGLVAAGVLALAVALMMLMTPQYESVARIRIDPSQNPLANKQQSDQTTLSPEAIETEVSAMSSLDVARTVVRELNLANDSEFAKGLDEGPDAARMGAEERETLVAQAVLKKLSVGREKLTYIIAMRFRSRDPVKSAKIVNSFADNYLKAKTGMSVGTASRQTQWYEQRLAELGNEMRTAEAALADYRARTGLVATDSRSSGTVVDQQIPALSGSLANAESNAAAAQAAYSSAREQISRGGIDSVSEVRNSPVIADLRSQRAQILRSMGEVQARYGDKHPESIRVRDQLASIDEQIRDEAARVVNSLAADAVSAQARAASLRNSLSQLEGARAQNTRNEAMAQSLERDAVAKRAAYDKMSEMALTSAQASQNSLSQAVIVERAQPPMQPSAPNKPLILALGLVAALVAGGGTIAVQEMLVTGMQTVEEVETALGIPVLAAVPKVAKSANPADILIERPTSLFAESLRIARASILGVRESRPPQVIALTSALPSEGKTTTSLAFARTLALNGAKTLLLECDVRRAALRHMVGDPAIGAGLVEVLHDEAPLDAAIQPSGIDNLDQLLVRSPFFSSENLFGDGKMEELLRRLRSRYESIVLDLPPLVGLADGRFLATMADAAVLAIRWNATPSSAAASALGWMRSDGANPIGAIYTMVDSSAEAIGGLYYSKKYSAYYQGE